MEWLTQFIDQASAKGTRRTPAYVPALAFGLSVILFFLLNLIKADVYIVWFSAALCIGTLMLLAYVIKWCPEKRLELLRSDTFLLKKAAIENRVQGDSICGITEHTPTLSENAPDSPQGFLPEAEGKSEDA